MESKKKKRCIFTVAALATAETLYVPVSVPYPIIVPVSGIMPVVLACTYRHVQALYREPPLLCVRVHEQASDWREGYS